MNLREFYDNIGQDYEAVLKRMMGKESFALMLIRAFLQDQTMAELETAMKSRKAEDIFNHAHTLKGVAANLGFKPLYDRTAELVEITRGGSLTGADGAYAEVKKEYAHILELLNQVDFQK